MFDGQFCGDGIFPRQWHRLLRRAELRGSEVGMQHATVYVEKAGIDIALKGIVYDLVPAEGLAAEYGVALELPKAIMPADSKNSLPTSNPTAKRPANLNRKPPRTGTYYAHTLIEGNVEWAEAGARSRKRRTPRLLRNQRLTGAAAAQLAPGLRRNQGWRFRHQRDRLPR